MKILKRIVSKEVFMVLVIIGLVVLFVLAILIWTGSVSFTQFLLVAFLFLLVGAIIQIVQDCRQFGIRKVFRLSPKEAKEANRIDILKKSLESQKDSVVLETTKFPNTLFVLNETGIYFLYLYPVEGVVRVCPNNWYLKQKNGEIQTINGFQEIKQIEEIVKQKITIPVQGLLVSNFHTVFDKISGEYPVLNDASIPFYIRRTDLDKMLGPEEITSFAQIIKENWC